MEVPCFHRILWIVYFGSTKCYSKSLIIKAPSSNQLELRILGIVAVGGPAPHVPLHMRYSDDLIMVSCLWDPVWLKIPCWSPRHEALNASSRSVLKHTVRTGMTYVSKVVIRRFVTRLRTLRERSFDKQGNTWNEPKLLRCHHYVTYNELRPRSAWASSWWHWSKRHAAPHCLFQSVHMSALSPTCIHTVNLYTKRW